MTKPQANPSARAIARKRTAPLSPAEKKLNKVVKKNTIAILKATSVTASNTKLAAFKSPDRPLTDKQKLFVKHWAAGDSISGAAWQAGYSDNASLAYRMVKDPAIIALYNEEKIRYEESVGMTRKKVMDGLDEAIQMARVLADPNAMIAGWREVGKMCGYYAPVAVKVEVNINDNTAYGRLMKMSDAELLELAKKDKLVLEMGDPGTPMLAEIKPEEAEVVG